MGRQHTLNPIATLRHTPLGIASTATTPLEAFTPEMEESVVRFTNSRIQAVIDIMDDLVLNNDKAYHVKKITLQSFELFMV